MKLIKCMEGGGRMKRANPNAGALAALGRTTEWAVVTNQTAEPAAGREPAHERARATGGKVYRLTVLGWIGFVR